MVENIKKIVKMNDGRIFYYDQIAKVFIYVDFSRNSNSVVLIMIDYLSKKYQGLPNDI